MWLKLRNHNKKTNYASCVCARTNMHTHNLLGKSPDDFSVSKTPLEAVESGKGGGHGNREKMRKGEKSALVSRERKWNEETTWSEDELLRERGSKTSKKRREGNDKDTRRVEKGKVESEWNATMPVTYLYNINYIVPRFWIMKEPYLTTLNYLAVTWPIVFRTRSISSE